MESGGIKAKQIVSHSSFNETLSPHQARLAGPRAWCSGQPSYGSLKIVFKILHTFCAVATQGFWEEGYFSTSYRLRIGTDKLEEEYIGINDSQVKADYVEKCKKKRREREKNELVKCLCNLSPRVQICNKPTLNTKYMFFLLLLHSVKLNRCERKFDSLTCFFAQDQINTNYFGFSNVTPV